MLDLPDNSAFAAALADPRFYAAAAISALSGAVRGFAGFGSALLYVPLISAVYEPRTAAATLLLIDLVCGAPFAIPALRNCNWRELLPVSLASAVMVPVGTLVLLWVDPVILRWIISILVMTLLAVIVSGWRYHGQPAISTSLGVGAIAGLGAGAVQIAGPAVIIYWLSGSSPAAVVRAT